MNFHKTTLAGAYVIDLEKIEDDRGFFTRAWCQKEFEEQGLASTIVLANNSFSAKAGTLRGIHYQVAPHQEAKVVRCIRGSIYDVIVDLRADSPTYKQWFGIELNADNYKMLYVPAYFGHGFMTLEDSTEIFYFVSEAYQPKAERGLRWDDPAINIRWPRSVEVISDKDTSWEDFSD